MGTSHNQINKVTLGGLLVTLGIIYGDIGTSPLYVMRAIMGDQPIEEQVVLGALSCIFWTITILATCVQNLFAKADRSLIASQRNRALLAGFFGLIHGAGFANYLRSLFLDDIFAPLLGFNLGIEAGQIFVLMIALTLFAALDWLVRRPHFAKWPMPPLLRTRLVSVLVGVIAGVWSVQRAPW